MLGVAYRSRLRQCEMRILDQADGVAERIRNGRDLDSAADVLNGRHMCRAARDEMLNRTLNLRDAPVCDAAAPRVAVDRLIRIEPEFVPGDIEANVERFVEVRLLLERRRVPLLCSIQIR